MNKLLQSAAAHEQYAQLIRAGKVPLEPAEGRIFGCANPQNMPPKAREAWALGHEMRAERLRRLAEQEQPPQPPRDDAVIYAAMSPLERARLSQAEPQRFARMRQALADKIVSLETKLRAAKSHAEYSATRSQIAQLRGVV